MESGARKEEKGMIIFVKMPSMQRNHRSDSKISADISDNALPLWRNEKNKREQWKKESEPITIEENLA